MFNICWNFSISTTIFLKSLLEVTSQIEHKCWATATSNYLPQFSAISLQKSALTLLLWAECPEIASARFFKDMTNNHGLTVLHTFFHHLNISYLLTNQLCQSPCGITQLLASCWRSGSRMTDSCQSVTQTQKCHQKVPSESPDHPSARSQAPGSVVNILIFWNYWKKIIIINLKSFN